MKKIGEKTLNDRLQDLICLNAPVFTGLKASAIINVAKDEYFALRDLSSDAGIRIFPLYYDKRISILIYREEKFKELFLTPALRQALSEIDSVYSQLGDESILFYFRRRFRAYKEHRIPFPHEVGIFLGYPLSDVKSYIENDGKNPLLIGYWKVYHNPSSALKIFQAYDVCIQSFQLLLSHGVPISNVLSVYAERSSLAA